MNVATLTLPLPHDWFAAQNRPPQKPVSDVAAARVRQRDERACRARHSGRC